MAFISQICSTANILVMASPHISQPLNPGGSNNLNRRGKQHSFGVSYKYNRGFHLEKTKGVRSLAVRAAASVAAENNKEVLELAEKENRRLLRMVYRVRDIERSIKFYTECFRMTLLERKDYGKSSHAFLGFGPQDKHFVVELFSTDVLGEFDMGTGFSHVGISARDLFSYVDHIKANGGSITQEPVDIGTTYNAFAVDPDGYQFELIQRPTISDLRLSHVNYAVSDLDRSISYYQKALGMEKLEKTDNEQFSMGMLGYAHEYETRPYLELIHWADQDQAPITHGNAYSHLAIGSNEVDNSTGAVNLVTKALGIIINTAQKLESSITPWSSKIIFQDPDGWKFVFYDNA